ncbi:MAG: arginine--tRNA ligase [Deltaproteobacteria bacterium]|nr:arginine--tRNA ligase [Deltaproteobacteria bacterium]
MKVWIKQQVEEALESLAWQGLGADWVVEEPKQSSHGDYSSNVAMVLAKPLKKNPREIAQALADALRLSARFDKVEIAGPGFLNFFLKAQTYQEALVSLASQEAFKANHVAEPQRILIEFVSANPTGPMHLGHGRNAVVGDTLARILEALGHQVVREFYINDHGVQIETLGRSGIYYFKKIHGMSAGEAPGEDMYRGEYVETLVKDLSHEIKNSLGDPLSVGKTLAKVLLERVKEDLAKVDIYFDHYFSEDSLYESSKIKQSIEALKKSGKTYEEEGALWFKTTDFGDDKDRVLIKSDGSYTYFTPDIAYHQDKFKRGFDLYLNVMGADHGGYVTRMKAAVEALGFDPQKLEFLLMQLVSLKRGEVPVAMSKRSGDYVTLKEIVEEVGADATRFFFLMRSHHTSLEFDLELAKSQSSENPVYYAQYAHARLASLLRKAAEAGIDLSKLAQKIDLSSLTLPEELDLIKLMLQFGDRLNLAASFREPHRVIFYLLELAKLFQNYYTQGKTDPRYRLLDQEEEVLLQKLFLVRALKEVLANLLKICGVSAPEKM